MDINPYAILGVPKNADASVIKKAYRKLAKKYHPDANMNNPAAEQKFKEIGDAYRILSDDNERRKYDENAGKRASAEEWARREEQSAHQTFDDASDSEPIDIANMAQRMQGGFERYFGFDPKTGEVTREDKLNVNAKKKKNPLDTSAMFDSFFSGFKK